jgi:hypothetical protein
MAVLSSTDIALHFNSPPQIDYIMIQSLAHLTMIGKGPLLWWGFYQVEINREPRYGCQRSE